MFTLARYRAHYGILALLWQIYLRRCALRSHCFPAELDGPLSGETALVSSFGRVIDLSSYSRNYAPVRIIDSLRKNGVELYFHCPKLGVL